MLPTGLLQEGRKLRLARVLVPLHSIMLQRIPREGTGLVGGQIIHGSHPQNGHSRRHPAEPYSRLIQPQVHIHCVYQDELLILVHVHLQANPETCVGLLHLHPRMHHHRVPPADLRHLPSRPNLVNKSQHPLGMVHHAGPLAVPFDQGLRGVWGGLHDGLGLSVHAAGVGEVCLGLREQLLGHTVDLHRRHLWVGAIFVGVIHLNLLLRDIQQLPRG
mmetsp:Transcript_51368/g.117083  ORF Transcript_51368/g.117083 Transcript_51368/m.117083 type:complete len:217 (-) Transcript_51368:259-909(-)